LPEERVSAARCHPCRDDPQRVDIVVVGQRRDQRLALGR